MIKVKKLTKKFGDLLVLNELDFEIGENEIVGLVGPNGAGKTTTMRILTGHLAFDSGEVEVLNNNMANQGKSLLAKKEIGYLAENNPLYPEMLTCEYLRMIGELKQINKDKINDEIKKVVEKAGLEKVYWRPISELSKGFKQRVGLGASILGNPKILILDEPTEGLDPNQRVDIRNLIKEFGKDKTVIISSHVLSEVENTCNRIIIINEGKIVADEKTHDILRKNKQSDILVVEIEGNNIQEKLIDAIGTENIISDSFENNRVKLEIKMPDEQEYRPKISELARENNWIIWEMRVVESKLEDIFRELTK
ncbi:ABC transporter ATP-binding protein [Candidatus Parcubacteria bacterium]|nr:ABC transporter ATP-binding protein [Candidatus Parcubacteria bacterium]